MMIINIKYTAQLKKAAGRGEEKMETSESATLEKLLQLLAQKHDEFFSKMLFDENDNFSNSVVLVLNGKQIRIEDDIVLKNNDQLLLLSPIAGG